MVDKGDRAPDFTLPADDGSEVSLEDLRGERVVLYFYPKDDTPGCTTQACDLRDDLSRIRDLNATVLGVSPDSVESHRKFKEKYDLNFRLLADEDHEVSKAYGVWQEKTLFGKKHWGVVRSTFILDEEGRVAEAWRRVSPKGHAERVIRRLAEEG